MTVREAEQYVSGRPLCSGQHAAQDRGRFTIPERRRPREVIITAPEFLEDAVVNGRGTHIVP